MIQLTRDGIPKALPVWSKDGSMVAFVEKTKPEEALARPVFLDSKGKTISDALVHPEQRADYADTGMRFVESIEWLTDHKVAVYGSVNPSTSEYLIFDVHLGKSVYQFFNDGPRAAFAPDGLNVAWESGCPDFTPVERCNWALNVDGKSVFPQGGSDVAGFLAGPRWSGDSRFVAAIYEEAPTRSQKLVVWRSGELSTTPLPVNAGTEWSLAWIGTDLFVASNPPGTHQEMRAWEFDPDARSLTQVSPAPILERKEVIDGLKNQLESLVEAHGGREADFWCKNCPLSSLPRRSSVND
jgi:hypothetical protein